MDPRLPAPETRSTRDVGAARFTGKVALVTGASDRGIGGAIVEQLVREGAEVALLSRRRPERLLKKVHKLAGAGIWYACDIASDAAVQRALEQVRGAHSNLDVVVNNAGVELARPLEQFTQEQVEELLQVNLHGAIRVIRAALPGLSARGGVIVNVGSALALGGCAGFSIYSAAKAGLAGLTQSLAWELAPRGIRVVCVAPGLVHTPMIHKHIEQLTQETWRRIEACHPLGMGMPHDVAAAVAFLASSDARWITGVTLPLGWSYAYPLPVESFMK